MKGRLWGQIFTGAFFVVFLCLPSLHARENVYSFIPVLKGQTFAILKTTGNYTELAELIVEQWTLNSKDSEAQNVDSLLKDYRQGRLPQPLRKHVKRVSEPTHSFYQVDLPTSNPMTSKIATFGLTQYKDSLFITHELGIDEISLDELLSANPQESSSIEIESFQTLPHATGVVFLDSAFSNILKITSQWDPIKQEWDVQHRDGSHTNVNIHGNITH